MTRRHTPERLTLDAILPHLRTKRISKRNGERHVLAHCPAHDDANPSLSLTEKADGTLLWKCFAGCSQDAVREALERLADTQPEPPDLSRLATGALESEAHPHTDLCALRNSLKPSNWTPRKFARGMHTRSLLDTRPKPPTAGLQSPTATPTATCTRYNTA